MTKRLRTAALAASLLLIVSCATRGMSPANVGKHLTHIDAVNSFDGALSHYECTGPQRDWDYLATDPTEVLLPLDDPKLIERTRASAAELLARMRARSR
jgi:hypothetical protein